METEKYFLLYRSLFETTYRPIISISLSLLAFLDERKILDIVQNKTIKIKSILLKIANLVKDSGFCEVNESDAGENNDSISTSPHTEK